MLDVNRSMSSVSDIKTYLLCIPTVASCAHYLFDENKELYLPKTNRPTTFRIVPVVSN